MIKNVHLIDWCHPYVKEQIIPKVLLEISFMYYSMNKK